MSVLDTAPSAPSSGAPTASTLPGHLLARAATAPAATAMRKKHLGLWRSYTWTEYADRAAAVGMGLRALGVESGDRVAIHSNNRPAWIIADMGVQGIGAISVGIYPTSPESEVEYLLSHSGSVVLIAEDEEQVDKVLAVREKLTDLRKVVVKDPRGLDMSDDWLMTLDELEALGAGQQDDFTAAVTALDPAQCAIIVYTSGTTGPPKGAMISHDNLMAAARGTGTAFEVSESDEVLSYLPLCHIAERLISVVNAVTNGYVVNFGESTETFAQDLAEVQPTFFLGVPRVWEKLMALIQIKMGDAGWLKRTNYDLWMSVGARIARRRWSGKKLAGTDGLLYLLGWIFLYRSLRSKIGMSRVRGALSGAAPISSQVLEFFWAMGVPVREAYGQTENTAQATIIPEDDVRIGMVGTPVPECEVRIADDGEILTRGPGTFLGYYRNPEATAETIDSEGWLHTGDIGELDEDGFLRITDRKKDIIITAGGKNISPSEIENKLKTSPYVREAVVIGDQRKYLTALIGIELDTVGDWATRRRIPFTTYHDLTTKPEVRELVADWIEKVNAELAQVETIKAFELLPKELDQEDGEVTATQKVKRRAIETDFSDLIEGMYR
ncbi:MAG: AMP-dependent synthetase/ligase [Acidimicrobiales bacterium]